MSTPSAEVTVLDRDWPGRALPVMPGDFSQYLPYGFGFAAPLIVRPWDDPLQALTRPSFYGFEERNFDPVRGAPLTDPAAGTVYFDCDIRPGDVAAVLRVMQVRVSDQDYAVFAGAARQPMAERYLDQARIVSKRALGALFGAEQEAAALADQPLSVGDYIARFVAEQRRKWNEPDHYFSARLDGVFGGDGDFAKEALCFGFMVENPYWSVYRIWSRAWLVTK